jgi:hypothetical protein
VAVILGEVELNLFVAAGAGHEIADGILGTLIVVKDCVHLLCDGHLDTITRGEAKRGGGAPHSFGYFAVETGENIRKLAAFA